MWHYEHGLVLQSIYAVDKKFEPWIKSMYDTKINEDGSINTYKVGEYNLDQINPGKHLFDLYKTTGEEKYRKAADILRAQLETQPRTQSGGFWHKKIYPWQMWLDGLYMEAPFYARYALEFETEKIEKEFEDILNQFVLVYTHTRNPDNGLLYHAWDESCKQLWANSETGCSPNFWGRAMGWFCMAIMDVIEIIDNYLANKVATVGSDAALSPVSALKSCRQKLASIASSLIEPVLSVQDEKSGLWYQVLDMGGREKNYLETSCSSMFVSFLYRVVRLHIRDDASDESVLAAAKKGYKGLCTCVTTDKNGMKHLSGICSVAGLGGNPYRDGSYAYYVKEAVVSDDFKGVGPFIFASLEAEKADGGQ